MTLSGKSEGFIVLTAVTVVFLISGILALLYLQVQASWRLTEDIEGRLRSISMAENGIETAKALIARSDLDLLLRGSDGVPCTPLESGWRNPMSLDLARTLDPRDWVPHCDDGLVTQDTGINLSRGLYGADDGFFALRFSNNPEEPPFEDQDQTVLVRSLGLVPERIEDPFLTGVKNHVYLVEAKLRKETSFGLVSALTVGGDLVEVELQGTGFLVDGRARPAVSFVSVQGFGVRELFRTAIQPDQHSCFTGSGESPSLQDVTELFLSERRYSRLLTVKFWEHFETHLPEFAAPYSPTVSPDQEGLFLLPGGGVLDSELSGIIVAFGDLQVSDGAELNGLLLHLGRGRLTFSGESSLVGAAWISNFDVSSGELLCKEIQLTLSDASRLIYDADAVERALQHLPATQLEWRVLFPEMVSD